MAPQVSEANPKTDVLILPGSYQSEDLGSGTKLNLILVLKFFYLVNPQADNIGYGGFPKICICYGLLEGC